MTSGIVTTYLRLRLLDDKRILHWVRANWASAHVYRILRRLQTGKSQRSVSTRRRGTVHHVPIVRLCADRGAAAILATEPSQIVEHKERDSRSMV
jgi:hypothetical protein